MSRIKQVYKLLLRSLKVNIKGDYFKTLLDSPFLEWIFLILKVLFNTVLICTVLT